MIAQRNLSLLSNRLARAGGRRIPEAVLERDYCLAMVPGRPVAHPAPRTPGFQGRDRAQAPLVRRLSVLRRPRFHARGRDAL
jgi:hypothetical protein